VSKLMSIFCVLFGHAKVVSKCFGYVSCARCGTQIGDTLAGVFDLEKYVIKGHNCDVCDENWSNLKIRERVFCGGKL